MVTQHTGSLNKRTKPQRSKRKHENIVKYVNIFSPPHTCARPFTMAIHHALKKVCEHPTYI